MNSTAFQEVQKLTAELIEGNRVALSKAITLCESHLPNHHASKMAVLEQVFPRSGNALRIGVSGIPGAGKSTFIEALGVHLIQEHHKKVAVLTVDPSSDVSGGSILGDKTRMNKLSRMDAAFIRPTPSNLELGGVAQFTQEAIVLCEAAGYDIVLVETVGVGQSEITVSKLTDIFILLQIIGTGDDLQAIKRGVLECVDIVVMNKADGDQIQQAKVQAQNLKKGMHLLPGKYPNWDIPVRCCSALEHSGIDEVWDTIKRCEDFIKTHHHFSKQRKAQLLQWFDRMCQHSLRTLVAQHPTIQELRAQANADVDQEKNNVFSLIQQLEKAFASLLSNSIHRSE